MIKSKSNYFEIKKNINQLKKLVKTNSYPEYHDTLLNKIFPGNRYEAITLENEKIYRARWNEKGSLFNRLQEVIYPPKNSAKKSRFNSNGQSLFYAALCELGTIIELRPDINKFFTISRFKLNFDDLPFFFKIGFPNNQNVKNTQKIVIDFLNSEITRRVSSEEKEDYNITILIGNQFLNKRLVLEKGKFTHAGIAYPT